jgi:hypothetical protein
MTGLHSHSLNNGPQILNKPGQRWKTPSSGARRSRRRYYGRPEWLVDDHADGASDPFSIAERTFVRTDLKYASRSRWKRCWCA